MRDTYSKDLHCVILSNKTRQELFSNGYEMTVLLWDWLLIEKLFVLWKFPNNEFVQTIKTLLWASQSLKRHKRKSLLLLSGAHIAKTLAKLPPCRNCLPSIRKVYLSLFTIVSSSPLNIFMTEHRLNYWHIFCMS